MQHQPYRIKTISEFHKLRGLPKPEHPLISIVDMEAIDTSTDDRLLSWTLDFYSISLKRTSNIKYRYGQQEYDFDEGVMFFMAPHQVFGISNPSNERPRHSGWLLLIHPDFMWNTSLAATIKKYGYFDYAVHEALFLSEKEETILAVSMY